MSEERFDRIDAKLDAHDQRFDRVEGRLDGIDARLDGHDQRFDRVEAHLDRIAARLDGHDQQLHDLNGRVSDLDRHMHVLHEDTMARIAGIREFDGPSRQEFNDALAEMEERIARRLDPIATIARDHEERINRLERRRPT